MCRCFLRKFYQKRLEIVQMSRYFFYSYKREHRYFVPACKNHLFVEVSYGKDRYSCKTLNYGTRDFCNNVERIINNKTIKICTKKIRKNFTKAMLLKKYLQGILTPFKCSFNFEGSKVYCKV